MQINLKKFKKILAKCFEIVYINLRAQKTPEFWDTQFNIECDKNIQKTLKKLLTNDWMFGIITLAVI